MLPDRVSNPGPMTYESGTLPIALRSPAKAQLSAEKNISSPRYDYYTVDRAIKPLLRW